jgi:hypothetical protein
VEYNIAPRWSFSASDMYNIDPILKKRLTKITIITSLFHILKVRTVFLCRMCGRWQELIAQVVFAVMSPAFSGLKV